MTHEKTQALIRGGAKGAMAPPPPPPAPPPPPLGTPPLQGAPRGGV